jgi:aryl-alcohol dehydrogenase-like predicted oxidoreductase
MAAALLPGAATAAGTVAYRARFAGIAADGHFRPLDGLQASSLGLGTYLGPEDDATDGAYAAAVARAVELGINVVDSAINYRHQRSERAVGAALRALVGGRRAARHELVVATKGGFLPADAAGAAGPGGLAEPYLRRGLAAPEDIVQGCHCLAPRYLADQIERSRRNLGVATIDVYFLHNPEVQLEAVDRDTFRRRLRAAFAALEAAVADGRLGRYGAATWHGFRAPAEAPAHLELAELVALARDVAGPDHHFRVIQLPYNLGMTEAFTNATQAVGGESWPALEAARRLGLFAMTSASIYQGRLARLPDAVAQLIPGLSTGAQRALQFARSTPGVGTALCGMSQAAHVEENAGLARVPPMPAATFARLFRPA